MAEIYTITGKINSVSQIDDGSDDWESDESNTVKKRPGPKSRTVIQNLSPQLESHSPLKLTIKRLPTCQEPAFEVVNKKKGRVRGGSASMDDMIPEGLGGSPHPHPVHTPSPTPSDILRPEGRRNNTSLRLNMKNALRRCYTKSKNSLKHFPMFTNNIIYIGGLL
ncbi:hypothetical protein J6590_042977 [Homalodisca vitripennis]|nr:hypothetical protein J6590_042977 [Homalodisca vitripennis]